MPRRTLAQRFYGRIDIDPDDPYDGCWEWTGSVDRGARKGYGKLYIGKIDGRHKTARAHRVAYELLVQPIPEGLVIDHLCRNRTCVNPTHMELVTDEENRARGIASSTKSHCVHGHKFTAENTYVNPRGHRSCRICRTRHRVERSRRIKADRLRLKESE